MKDDIKNSFEELEKELRSQQSTSVDVSAENMDKVINREKLAVLFELAELSINDPNYESRFVNVEVQRPQKIRASKLLSELAKVEEKLRRPVMNLKLANLWSQNKNPGLSAEEGKQLSIRLSFLMEAGICILAGFFWTSLYLSIFHNEYIPYAFALWKLSAIEFLYYLTLVVPAIMIIYPCYALLFLFIFGQTISDIFFGLEVKPVKGGVLLARQILLRSIFAPIACFFGGFLGIIFNLRSFQDYLAGTKITIKEF